MSGGHGHVDKTLEKVKEWFLALTFAELGFGLVLFFVPVGMGNLFLYETQALPVQMLGAAYLSLGILMIIIRDFNQSAYRLVLDFKILLGGFTTIALLLNLVFSDVRWTLLIILLIVIAITGICVYLRRMIPRTDADDSHDAHDDHGAHH